jgi:hypothetical protein
MSKDSFSRRNQYTGAPKEITVREDAPEGLRFAVLAIARDLGLGPTPLREIICRTLRVTPNAYNWSDFPNVWEEVQELMFGCEWFRVYDIIEALYVQFARDRSGAAETFEAEVNEYFLEEGIGWQLVNGQAITRGAEAFEAVARGGVQAVAASGRPTAAGHIHEALQDLSRRPNADLAGPIYHAMGALEAVARDLAGDPKGTLGEILKRNPDLLPKPLDTALSQVWGYASNEARHVQEGREPSREKASCWSASRRWWLRI